MIEYAKKKYYVYTRISTNLNILSEENAEKLVTSGLDYLTLSIDGASQETYSRYRVGGDFDKVLKNLNLVIAAKNALKSQTPKLVWQFLLFRHNEHEVEKAKALAEKMGLIFSLMPAYIRPEKKNWFPSREAVERYGLGGAVEYKVDNPGPKVQTSRICKWLWTHLIVGSNGSVSPCCRLTPSDATLGNIHQSKDFFDIWNNDKFRSARRFFISGKKQTPETFCETCSSFPNRDIVPLSVILPNVPSRKLRAARFVYATYKDLLRHFKSSSY